MLLYCRTDEKMTINSTEMTLGVSAVPKAALAAGSWVFSAAPSLSVLAAVAEGHGGIPFITLSLLGFSWMKKLRGLSCSGDTSPAILASCCNGAGEIVLPSFHLLPKKSAFSFAEELAWVRAHSAELWKPQQILGSAGAMGQDWLSLPCSSHLPPGEETRGTKLLSFLYCRGKKIKR